MSCSNCKKKEFKEELEKTTGFVSKSAIWFVIIWSVFALYGIYSLVSKFL